MPLRNPPDFWDRLGLVVCILFVMVTAFTYGQCVAQPIEEIRVWR